MKRLARLLRHAADRLDPPLTNTVKVTPGFVYYDGKLVLVSDTREPWQPPLATLETHRPPL